MANYFDREGPRRRHGRERSAFDRYSGYEPDENYFGSGRMNYGEGYSEPGQSRGDRYGSSDYDNERRSGYDRDRGREASLRGPHQGRGNYERGDYGYRGYGSLPESERGYFTDRDYDRTGDRGWWDRTSDEISSWFGDEQASRRREADYRRDHRGRGPKNYSRSDDRIREDINDRLTESSFIDASEIDVAVSDHEVTLTGTVETRYEKRMAEDIADDVTGVTNVENRIRVSPMYGSSTSYGQTTTDETPSTISRGRASGS